MYALTNGSTSPDMTIVFHVSLDVKFIETKDNLKKKLHRTYQGPNFPEGSVNTRNNVRTVQKPHYLFLIFHIWLSSLAVSRPTVSK